MFQFFLREQQYRVECSLKIPYGTKAVFFCIHSAMQFAAYSYTNHRHPNLASYSSVFNNYQLNQSAPLRGQSTFTYHEYHSLLDMNPLHDTYHILRCTSVFNHYQGIQLSKKHAVWNLTNKKILLCERKVGLTCMLRIRLWPSVTRELVLYV